MKRLALFIGVTATMALCRLFGYRVLIGGFPTTWHQRMTVVIDTPRGKMRGAAVTEISNREDDGLLQLQQSSGIRTILRGEAVVVEVTPGRYLFVLSDGAETWAMRAFNLNDQPDPNDRTNHAVMTRLRNLPLDTPAELPVADYPMFVTFADISKPETVQRLNPAKLADAFGPGVSLDALTLEVTSEQVTTGRLRNILEWLGPYPEPHLLAGDGRTADVPFAMTVAVGDFLSELP